MIYYRVKLQFHGLRNNLFPWARCMLFSSINNIPILETVWFQVKPGAILRREKDLRFYHNIFKKDSQEVHGLTNMWERLVLKKIPESENFEGNISYLKENNVIIEFKGCGSYFKDLNGHNKFIYERILSITRDERLKEVERLSTDLPLVGIHIRRGDFFWTKVDAH